VDTPTTRRRRRNANQAGVAASYNAGDAIPASITFTRASTATYIDIDGNIRTKAINAARDSHYINGIRYLLLEVGRTNGWTFSEDLTNAAWTKNGVTVSADATKAPDTALTMDKILETATTAVHCIDRAPPAMTDNAAQSFTVFAQAAERNWLLIEFTNKAGLVSRAYVNLTTGVTGTVDAGYTRVLVRAMNNGTYRIQCTIASAGTGATTPQLRFQITTADATFATYLGVITNGLYLWGFQFEANQVCSSSYIPTTAATVTRSNDNWLGTFTPVPQAMTLYINAVELGTSIIAGNPRLIQIGSAATGPHVEINTSGVRYQAQHYNNTTTVTSLAAVAPAINDKFEQRLVLGSNGSVLDGQTINGGAEATVGPSGANALQPAWDALQYTINSRAAANVGIIAIRSYAIILGTASMVQCRAFAATPWNVGENVAPSDWWSTKSLLLNDTDACAYMFDRMHVVNRPLTQSSASAKPTFAIAGLNALPALRLTVDDFMIADAVSTQYSGDDIPYTFAGVVSWDTVSAATTFAGLSRSTSATAAYSSGLRANNTGGGRFLFARNDDTNTPVTAIADANGAIGANGAHTFVVVFNGTMVSAWVDGIKTIDNANVDAGVATLDRFTIGCLRRSVNSGFASGYFAEALISPNVISDASALLLHAYLKSEWGTP
jgi:hypothetical protein